MMYQHKHLLIVFLLSWALLPANIASAKPDGVGKVVYVTRSRAYFDVGRKDGLIDNAPVRIYSRKKGKALRCRVDKLSESFSSCSIRRAVSGSKITFTKSALKKAALKSDSGPNVRQASARQLQSAKRQLSTVVTPWVQDEESGYTPRSFELEAMVRHQSWVAVEKDGYHRQHISLIARDVPLGFLGLKANIDWQVLNWVERPESSRFLSRSEFQLFVRETYIERKLQHEATYFALGRMYPVATPGVSSIDGVQFGWHFDNQTKFGIFAGGVPHPVNLEPSIERWVAGAYGSKTWAVNDSWTRITGRANVANGETEGLGAETELQLASQFGGLYGFGTARAQVSESGAFIPNAHGLISYAPISRFSVVVDASRRDRIPSIALDEYAPVAAERIGGSLRFVVLSWLETSLSGGFNRVDAQDDPRSTIGIEIGTPFFGRKTFSWLLGHQTAVGNLAGFFTYANFRLRPVKPLTVKLQVVHSVDDEILGVRDQSILGQFAVDWWITKHIGLQVGTFVRAELISRDVDESPIGFNGELALVGRL